MPALQQRSLFDIGDPDVLSPLAGLTRTPLAGDAWIDLLPGWLSGAGELFDRLAGSVPWKAERRQMYDGVVAVPRLLKFYDAGEPLPDPVMAECFDALNAHYSAADGGPFASAGLCLYRDGRDSVAWHGDRIGRGATHDTMVAILSVGAPRPLCLRPLGGREELRFRLGHGDLIVMGGSCQRTWEHAIPKTARVVGPRISIQFRPVGVR
ncbi:MAG: alpha-ketoglutarate-dependent dioxygenase AlkB [Mycobacteriales bacterium]